MPLLAALLNDQNIVKLRMHWNSQDRRSLNPNKAISARNFHLYDVKMSYEESISFCDKRNGRLIDLEHKKFISRFLQNVTNDVIWIYDCHLFNATETIVVALKDNVTCNDHLASPFCQFDEPIDLSDGNLPLQFLLKSLLTKLLPTRRLKVETIEIF